MCVIFFCASGVATCSSAHHIIESSNETRAATITDSKEQVETLGATTRDSKEPDDAPPLWEVLLLGCVWQNGHLKFKYDHYRQEGGAMMVLMGAP